MAEIGNVNFKMLCRFCLSTEGEMLSINGKDPSRLANSIREKILFTTSIKIPSGEEPAVICINCDILLNGYFIFKKRSWANNLKVQELIQQHNAGEHRNWESSKRTLSSFHETSEQLLDEDTGDELQNINFPSNVHSQRKRLLFNSANGSTDLETVKNEPGTSGSENGTSKMGEQSLHSNEQEDSGEEDNLLTYLRLELAPNNYMERKQCVSPNGWGVMLIRRCNECGAKFTALSELRKHKADLGHTDPKCDICNRTFFSPTARDNHKKKKHKISEAKIAEVTSSGKKQRRCTECGEWFPTLADLRIHKQMLKHSDPTCSICLRKFLSKEACERHLRKRHKVNNPGSIQKCSICGMSFAKKKDLLAHISIHIGVNNSGSRGIEPKHQDTPQEAQANKRLAKHLCSLCGKGFATMKSVQQHKISAHSAASKSSLVFTCPICSKVFHYKKRLEDHLRLHIGFAPAAGGHTTVTIEPLEEGEIQTANLLSVAKKSPRVKKSWNRYEFDSDFVVTSNSSPEHD